MDVAPPITEPARPAALNRGASGGGLTQPEAEARFKEFGPNEPVTAKLSGPLIQFLHFCTNPLVLILLVAAALSGMPARRSTPSSSQRWSS
jgi:magnesium-transporting ATPase (P-type)